MVDRFSFSLTTFNKDGKLNQVEYATQAVSKNGETCIGIKGNHGCVVIAEKQPKGRLYIQESMKKIVKINQTIFISFSGLSSDFNTLISQAFEIAKDYQMKYLDDISPLVMVKKMSLFMQDYTQANGVRPFGTSLLICGFQKSTNEYVIYQCDPAGTSFAWKGVSIGQNSDSNQKKIEKAYSDEMNNEDAISVALKSLKSQVSYPIAKDTVEIATMDHNGIQLLSEEDNDVYIRQL